MIILNGPRGVTSTKRGPNTGKKGQSPVTEIKIIHEGPIVKRKDAIEQGLTYYFTGKPCKYGHIDKRFTSCRKCDACNLEKSKEWGFENKEKKASYDRVRRKKNPEYFNEIQKEWAKRNPEKIRMMDRVNKAKRRSSGSLTSTEVSLIFSEQKGLCANPFCRIELGDDYHLDHIMPVRLGGKTCYENIQCLCVKCNMSKSGKHPHEWIMDQYNG